MNRAGPGPFALQIILDLFCSGCTIGLLLMACVTLYGIALERVAVLSNVLKFAESRLEIMVERSHSGVWLNQPEKTVYRQQNSSMEIEDGAIHITIIGPSEKQQKKMVSVRPAINSSDTLGPVFWVAGGSGRSHVQGIDRTTLSGNLILASLK